MSEKPTRKPTRAKRSRKPAVLGLSRYLTGKDTLNTTDLLAEDSINKVIADLIENRLMIAGLVVIGIGHDKDIRMLSTLSEDGTLATLVRAQEYHLATEGMYLGDDEDDDESEDDE